MKCPLKATTEKVLKARHDQRDWLCLYAEQLTKETATFWAIILFPENKKILKKVNPVWRMPSV